MSKTVGIKSLFWAIFLIWFCRADICRAEGYFRLVLIDGTVVEGEMIRVTPATIEIDPEGPEEFASYNRGKIFDIVYMKQRPDKKQVSQKSSKSEDTGILAIKFNFESNVLPSDTIRPVHDYVMIDGMLYFTGRYGDFRIELPEGRHAVELCGVNMAYYEPTDFYSLENGGTSPRVWRQANSFIYGRSMNVKVRGDMTSLITLERKKENIFFVSQLNSIIIPGGRFLSNCPNTFRKLNAENGIVPGKVVFEELPKNYVYHDSLEYRYQVVFNESEWARFNDGAYLPGNYVIEARTIAWNTWKAKLIGETVSRCEMEIKSRHTTIVKYESFIDRLDCKVIVLPDSWFEISTRESQ